MLFWRRMEILVMAEANPTQFGRGKKNIIFATISIVLIHQILRQLRMPSVHLRAICVNLHIGMKKQCMGLLKRVGTGSHNKQSILGLIVCLFVYKQ